MIGLLVMCNEGARCLPTINQIRRLCSTVYVIHDGEPNDDTRRIISRYADHIYIKPKMGCKEPHLAEFFSNYENVDDWILHFDTDEVLSEELSKEISIHNSSDGIVYYAKNVDINQSGSYLRYRRISRGKVILFQPKSVQRIIGIPHVGLKFEMSKVSKLNNPLHHYSSHVNASYIEYLFGKLFPFGP